MSFFQPKNRFASREHGPGSAPADQAVHTPGGQCTPPPTSPETPQRPVMEKASMSNLHSRFRDNLSRSERTAHLRQFAVKPVEIKQEVHGDIPPTPLKPKGLYAGLALRGTPGVSLHGTPAVALRGTLGLSQRGTPGLALRGTPGASLGGTPGLAVGGTPGLAVGGTPRLAAAANPGLSQPGALGSSQRATPLWRRSGLQLRKEPSPGLSNTPLRHAQSMMTVGDKSADNSFDTSFEKGGDNDPEESFENGLNRDSAHGPNPKSVTKDVQFMFPRKHTVYIAGTDRNATDECIERFYSQKLKAKFGQCWIKIRRDLKTQNPNVFATFKNENDAQRLINHPANASVLAFNGRVPRLEVSMADCFYDMSRRDGNFLDVEEARHALAGQGALECLKRINESTIRVVFNIPKATRNFSDLFDHYDMAIVKRIDDAKKTDLPRHRMQYTGTHRMEHTPTGDDRMKVGYFDERVHDLLKDCNKAAGRQECSIFIHGIPPGSTEQTVCDLMGIVDEPINVTMRLNKTGNLLTWVEFRDEDLREEAIARFNGIRFRGRVLKVEAKKSESNPPPTSHNQARVAISRPLFGSSRHQPESANSGPSSGPPRRRPEAANGGPLYGHLGRSVESTCPGSSYAPAHPQVGQYIPSYGPVDTRSGYGRDNAGLPSLRQMSQEDVPMVDYNSSDHNAGDDGSMRLCTPEAEAQIYPRYVGAGIPPHAADLVSGTSAWNYYNRLGQAQAPIAFGSNSNSNRQVSAGGPPAAQFGNPTGVGMPPASGIFSPQGPPAITATIPGPCHIPNPANLPVYRQIPLLGIGNSALDREMTGRTASPTSSPPEVRGSRYRMRSVLPDVPEKAATAAEKCAQAQGPTQKDKAGRKGFGGWR